MEIQDEEMEHLEQQSRILILWKRAFETYPVDLEKVGHSVCDFYTYVFVGMERVSVRENNDKPSFRQCQCSPIAMKNQNSLARCSSHYSFVLFSCYSLL